MSGNTFGHTFCVTNFGESHGPAIGCVIDGCPPGMALSEADIQVELDRRKPGTSRHVTQRQESDRIELLSGLFEGRTTGTSIGFVIRNEDQRSRDYGNLANSFRPGHADYTYWQKYGIRDYRGGGRSSARETAVRVAAAAIAKKWLNQKYGIVVRGYMSQLGPIEVPFKSWDGVNQNPFFVADPAYVAQLEEFMDKLRKSGDSVGAQITTVASGVPVGWGEPVYDKLDADLAYNMMNINAVKGVEIGAGFAAVSQRGTEHSDEMSPQGFLSNNAGGVLGGISSGQDVVVHVAVKPTSSIRTARESIDKEIRTASPGTYTLGDVIDGKFKTLYVGRADKNLKQELQQRVGQAPRFKYQEFSDAKSAYDKQCELFHFLRPRGNTQHPSAPGTKDWKCPECGT